jgi:hypothetical protein
VEIKARLRKRHDRDIKDAIRRLNPEEGEMSDIVREGARIVLSRLGVMQTIDDLKCLERRSE